jgi:hypothetical protein
MTDPTPAATPPWLFEGPAGTVMDDPQQYSGGSPIARPIWSDWSLHPSKDDGKGGVKP